MPDNNEVRSSHEVSVSSTDPGAVDSRPQIPARRGLEAARCVRRAGLRRLCEQAQGSAQTKIALIDGLVETNHPSLRHARFDIVEAGVRARHHSAAAAGHATFIASVLAGEGADFVGLCPRCPIVNIPAIDEEMLAGHLAARECARRLVEAINLAVTAGARIIQLSLALGFGDEREGRWIAEALTAAARTGVKIIMAASPRGLTRHNPLLWLDSVIPVIGADPQGKVVYDRRWGVAMAIRGLSAPGTDIPGAMLPAGSRLGSGSSFAACFVTATLALLRAAVPGAPLHAAALALFGDIAPPPHVFSTATPRHLNGDMSLSTLMRLMGGPYDR